MNKKQQRVRVIFLRQGEKLLGVARGCKRHRKHKKRFCKVMPTPPLP